jgi:hypothetical protein
VRRMEESSQTKPETVAVTDRLDPNEEKELQEEIEADPGKADLNVLGDGMCLYPGIVRAGEETLEVNVLVDSGASHSFVAKRIMDAFLTFRRTERTRPLSITLPNGEEMKSNPRTRIPLRMDTWTGNSWNSAA